MVNNSIVFFLIKRETVDDNKQKLHFLDIFK